jgi:hypothetical protein
VEGIFLFPPVLPLRFKLLGHLRGVTMRMLVAGLCLARFVHADLYPEDAGHGFRRRNLFMLRSGDFPPERERFTPRLVDYPNTGPNHGKERRFRFLDPGLSRILMANFFG